MKKLIPADTVDSEGNVWETTGENIRRGVKEYSESDIKAIVDVLFPVGSVFAGENNFILSVGKWEQIIANSGRAIILGENAVSGSSTRLKAFTVDTAETRYTILRLFKRVS